MRPESSDSAARTELREMVVRLVHSSEQPRYQELMREHHYLGHLPKMGFLKLLRADARRLLCRTILSPPYHLGGSKMKLTAEQMRSLPCFFSQIPDPRRTQGRRHRLSTVLGIAAGGVLCGMRGYKAIADWAQSLGQKSRERFGCRREQGHYVVP